MDQSLKFTFDLPLSSMHLINNSDLSFLAEAMDRASMLGIDTETKPTFSIYNKQLQPTSIIQIAVRSGACEEVFIIDMLTMRHDEILLRNLDLILLKPFSDTKIVKIGQGLRQDLQELRISYPQMTAFKSCKGVLDTNTLHRYIHSEVCRDVSLKELTRSYLHFDLDKAYQISNWGRRPLSMEQLHYAACDSLVLLRLFDTMTCEAEEMGNFDINDLLVDLSSPGDDQSKAQSSSSTKRRRESMIDECGVDKDNALRINFHCSKERSYYLASSTSEDSSSCNYVGIHLHFNEAGISTLADLDKQIETSSIESRATSTAGVSTSSVSDSCFSSPILPLRRSSNPKISPGWLPLHRQTKILRLSLLSKLR